MKVSIIIRCFNEEKHIGRLFSDIQNQKVDFEYEIVVVDSGSTDRTLEVIKNQKYKLVRISPEEFTFGFSLNKGIEAAKGDYCVIVSAHCYPTDENWLAYMIQPFEDKKVALVYGRQVGTETSKYSEKKIFLKWYPAESEVNAHFEFCNNANSAIRRDLWKQYKFNERLTGLEDLDWSKHFKSEGHLIAYQAQACVYHVHNETPRQIYNRYYREALAFKEIYPNQFFGYRDFLKFFLINVLNDYLQAHKEGVIWKNLYWIPLYRLLQFWGTCRAHHYRVPINQEMQKRLYYPADKNEREKFYEKKWAN